jgi:hypothetical protein
MSYKFVVHAAPVSDTSHSFLQDVLLSPLVLHKNLDNTCKVAYGQEFAVARNKAATGTDDVSESGPAHSFCTALAD